MPENSLIIMTGDHFLEFGLIIKYKKVQQFHKQRICLKHNYIL